MWTMNIHWFMVVPLLYLHYIKYVSPSNSIHHKPYTKHNNTYFICSLHIYTNAINVQNTECECSLFSWGRKLFEMPLTYYGQRKEKRCLNWTKSDVLPWLQKKKRSKSYRFDIKCWMNPTELGKSNTDFHSIRMEVRMESHMWNESCFGFCSHKSKDVQIHIYHFGKGSSMLSLHTLIMHRIDHIILITFVNHWTLKYAVVHIVNRMKNLIRDENSAMKRKTSLTTSPITSPKNFPILVLRWYHPRWLCQHVLCDKITFQSDLIKATQQRIVTVNFDSFLSLRWAW